MKKSVNLLYEFVGYRDPTPKILPIITKPFPDELFSSWILRCSHRHELKPHVFAKFVWGNVAIWNRDIDKSIKRTSLELICSLNQISYQAGFQTTLRSYEGVLFPQLNENGAQSFITTAGIYHRKRKQYALMYCPVCLKEAPYFRKHWRISIICCCTKCCIYLMDKCPHCATAIMPFRLNIEKKRLFSDLMLNTCWNCKRDLADTHGVPAAPEIVIFTKRIESKLRFQKEKLDPFFNRLIFLNRVLVSNRKLIYYLKSKGVCSIPNVEKPRKNVVFEFLDLEYRIEVMKGAKYLLDKWPVRFRTFVKITNINYSDLVQEQKHKHYYPADLLSILKPKTT